ncbi:MAG: hypothetical protein QOD03_627 [Verrucomicrobiota bacterium]|jgi:hypothetical protein
MSKLSKLLLAGSVIGLMTGLLFSTNLVMVRNPLFFLALPLGAVLAGLFIISLLLHKETALYNEEHESHAANFTPEHKCCGHCSKNVQTGIHAEAH